MGLVNGVAVLVAGALWVVACVALLIALRVSRREGPPRRRAVLLAVADEFLAVTRQAERCGSGLPTSTPAISDSPSGVDQFVKYHEQAVVLFELLRSQLVEGSPALHHAEAIISALTIADEHATRLDVHRTMFAGAIWENVDREPERQSATHAPTARRRLRHARHSLWHR
jgi:hypothetical protein